MVRLARGGALQRSQQRGDEESRGCNCQQQVDENGEPPGLVHAGNGLGLLAPLALGLAEQRRGAVGVTVLEQNVQESNPKGGGAQPQEDKQPCCVVTAVGVVDPFARVGKVKSRAEKAQCQQRRRRACDDHAGARGDGRAGQVGLVLGKLLVLVVGIRSC